MEQSNIIFSIGKYVRTPNEQLKTVSLNLAKLIDLFSKPIVTSDKMRTPYFLRCTGTHRNNNSVSNKAALLIIDADKRLDWLNDWQELDGSISPKPVHYCLADYGINHLIYSSFSNGETHDKKGNKYPEPVIKWRAVIPCNYPQSRLKDCVQYVINLLHENHCFIADAKENCTWSQAWFMPSCHPDRLNDFEFFSYQNGNALSLDDVPIFEQVVEETSTALLNEPKPLHREPLATPSTINSNSPILEFNSTYSIDDVLTRNGYKRATNGKYLSPNSSSGIAGLLIIKDDNDNERALSYHNDILNDGKAHDAWDCYRLLECGGNRNRALNWNAELTKQNQREYMASIEREYLDNLSKAGVF